jgi:hypothetical protein
VCLQIQRYDAWIRNKFRKWKNVFKTRWRLRQMDKFRLREFLSKTVPEMYAQYKLAFEHGDITAIRRLTTENAFYVSWIFDV